MIDFQNKKYLTLEYLQSSEVWHLLEPYFTADITNARQLLYHYNNKLTCLPKCACGVNLSWHPDKKEYRKFCSKKCTAVYTKDQVKLTNLQKYGVEYYSQTSDFNRQVKKTSLQKYGVEHYSQTEEYIKRTTDTNIQRYGVPVASQNATIKENTKQYFIANYGVSNPMQHPAVKDKLFDNNLSKYGVVNPSQIHYSDDVIKLLNDSDAFRQLCETTPIRVIAKQYNISVNPLYSLVKKLNISLPKFNQSTFESEIYNFVSMYVNNVIQNDKTILAGKELDLFLPAYKLAIECNGTYWHSELNGRNRLFHLQKTKQAANAGINLIHIWEHTWNQKQDIVKSMLLSRLGFSQKIGARKCIIAKLDKHTSKQFFDSNHLQGDSHQLLVCYGLFYQTELVCAMSFGKNRFGKSNAWELLRFANKLQYNVLGGASKLFNHFIKNNTPEKVVSYCDLSHSTGEMYKKLGFTKSHTSQPNYFYTLDYQHLYSRNKFQKHKLKKLLPVYDPLLSEWDNMKNNHYDRIWDCGNLVFVWKKHD